MKKKRIIPGIILLVLLLMIGTRQLWTKQLWPDGYYKNIPQHTEEKTTRDLDIPKEGESTGIYDSENESDGSNEKDQNISEKETAENNEETTENNKENVTALDKVYGLDYYNQLTNKQKKIYRQIQEACKKYKSKVKVDPVKKENCLVAFSALTYDHPEFYWLNNEGTTFQRIGGKIVQVQFDIDKNAKKNSKKIATEAQKIIKKSKKYSTTYEKIKCLYKSLIDLAEYKKGKHDQDIRSAFLEKNTVCNGYSEAFLYLCKSIGINCAYAQGKSHREPHAWNLVEIEGKYYWIDVTWGDSSSDTTKTRDKISYQYLCVTDKEFFRDHTLSKGIKYKGYNKEYFKYPKCTDTTYYYFQRRGCYFTAYDQKTIKSYIKKSVKKNLYKDIELKFSNEKAYKAAFDDLLTKSHIYDIIGKKLSKKTDGYSYRNDEKTYYLTIQFNKK